MNVSHRNMLGVLLMAVMAVFAVVSPAYGAEGVTAIEEKPVAVVEKTAIQSTATISTDDLAALKSALDALQKLLSTMEVLIAELPKGTEETRALALGINETLGKMSLNLTALNGTLAVATVIPGKNFAQAGLKPVVLKDVDKLAGLSIEKDTDSEVGMVATEEVEKADNRSLLAQAVNSPQGVIILLAFSMIFGVIIFMRRSRAREEAQLA